MSEQRPPRNEGDNFIRGLSSIAKMLLAIFILWASVQLVAPYVVRWADCQRLAPIERWVTRGC